jgi:hypothetical protein
MIDEIIYLCSKEVLYSSYLLSVLMGLLWF